MSSQHRHRRHSRSHRRSQWALWLIAGLLIYGTLASRQWFNRNDVSPPESGKADRVVLQSPPTNSPPQEADPPATMQAPSEPPLLPKPELDSDKRKDIWRPGDALELSRPSTWADAGRYESPDPALISNLHGAGLAPQVIRRSGDLLVRRDWQGGRSQLAIVESKVARFAGSQWRMIYAIALRAEAPEPALATRLAIDGASSVAGGWIWDRGYWFASVHLPADASDSAMISAVEYVLIAADDLERELTGDGDEF